MCIITCTDRNGDTDVTYGMFKFAGKNDKVKASQISNNVRT